MASLTLSARILPSSSPYPNNPSLHFPSQPKPRRLGLVIPSRRSKLELTCKATNQPHEQGPQHQQNDRHQRQGESRKSEGEEGGKGVDHPDPVGFHAGGARFLRPSLNHPTTTTTSSTAAASSRRRMALCSARTLLVLFVLSALPVAYIISLELANPTTHTLRYHSSGFFRESVAWDNLNRRFLVSFIEGGVGEVRVPDDDDQSPATVLKEVPVVKDADLAGYSSLGIFVDRPRNRLLVAVTDVLGNKYSALAAYDLSTWKRLFLTQLSGPNDEKSLADDVVADAEGNAYVTDAKASKIWKVGKDGEFLSIIRSPLFTSQEWYKNLVALNGIVYHPDGYLLVVHTFGGNLYKIDLAKGDEVKIVSVAGGPLSFGDGLELVSPTKLVVAGNPCRLVESTDGWETAAVVGKFSGPAHRLASAATVKDGKVYINHLFGMGYPKKTHAIVEAVFSK